MSVNPLDKSAIRQKYAEERAKRLRPDGNDQYRRLEGRIADTAVGPYMPVRERPTPPRHDLAGETP